MFFCARILGPRGTKKRVILLSPSLLGTSLPNHSDWGASQKIIGETEDERGRRSGENASAAKKFSIRGTFWRGSMSANTALRRLGHRWEWLGIFHHRTGRR